MDGNFHPTQAAKRACGGDNSWKPGTTMGNGKPPPPKRPRVPLQPFSGSGGGPMARQRAQLPIYDARAALITAVKENKSIIGAPWLFHAHYPNTCTLYTTNPVVNSNRSTVT